MDTVLFIKLLCLLGAANYAPLLARKLLGARLSFPIDSGRHFFDGRPLLGEAKTLRGLVASVLLTALVAPLLAMPMLFGALFASASMVGDLFSSFIKRRLGKPSSSMCPGLDQIPEALLPLLIFQQRLDLSVPGIVGIVAAFWVCELLASRILYRFNLRDHPY
ncbi:MAG: CDP-archaeol synthase [Porticoccaceae bacterium]|nr:CDP-archaeol synthase [Porticoccaceae bacterium]